MDREKCQKKCTLTRTDKTTFMKYPPYSLPVLHMGKTCYVDFFCLDPIIGKMRRKKYHLDKFKTVAEKKARGAEIITSVTARLRSGILMP